MDRLLHRDLRNRSSEVLRAVAAGQSFEITNRGEVVALLVPAGAEPPLRIRKATASGGFGEFRRVRRGEATSRVLNDLRGDR